MDGEGNHRERFNVAEIGFEFGTRRRNKFVAGFLREAARKQGRLEFELKLSVNQAIGYVIYSCLHQRADLMILLRNCPKYINVRELIPHPDIQPEVVLRVLDMDCSARLPDDIIQFVQAAYTVFHTRRMRSIRCVFHLILA